MNNSNIWNVTSKLSQQFGDTSDNMTCVLQNLLGVGGAFANTTKSVVGASGNAYNISYSTSTDTVNITAFDGTSGTSSEFSYIADILSDSSVSDAKNQALNVINDVKQGQSLNEAISKISEKFLNHNKMGSNDVKGVLDTIPNLASQDYNAILSYCESTMTDGAMTKQNFLSVVSAISTLGRKTTQGGGLVMDTSSPFVLQSFLSTVLTVLESAFNAIVQAIGLICGGLIYAISTAISTIITAFKQIASSTLDINPNVDNGLVQGPFKYATSSTEYATWAQDDYLKRWDIPGFSTYAWPAGGGDYNYNGFLCINFKADEFIGDFLTEYGSRITAADDHNLGDKHYYVSFNPDSPNGHDLFYTLCEYYKVHQNDDKYNLDIPTSIQLSENPEFATRQLYYNIVLGMALSLQSVNTTENVPVYYIVKDPTNEKNCYFYGEPFVKELYARKNNDSTRLISSMTTSDIITNIQLLYTKVFTPTADTLSGSYEHETSSALIALPDSDYYGFSNLLGGWATNNLMTNNTAFNDYNFPMDRQYTIPSITTSTLIAALALIGGVVAVTAAAYAIGKRKFTKWRMKTQLQDTSNLLQLRKNYIEGGLRDEDFNALYKAQRKYNLKSKFLGFQSFDATNGWFNDTSSSAVSGMSSNLSSLSDAPTISVVLKTIRGF